MSSHIVTKNGRAIEKIWNRWKIILNVNYIPMPNLNHPVQKYILKSEK